MMWHLSRKHVRKLSIGTLSTLIFISMVSSEWRAQLNPSFFSLTPPIARANHTATFSFDTSADGWTYTTDNATCSGSYVGGVGNPAGSLQISGTKTGGNQTCASYWEWSGTWEDIGVPAGHLVNGVTGSYDFAVSANSGLSSLTTGAYELRDSTGTLRNTLVANLVQAGTIGFTTRTGTPQTFTSEASNTTVRLRLNTTINFGGGNKDFTLQNDTITLAITHFDPNNPPDQPTNQSPTDLSTVVTLNPTLTGSAYSDIDSDPHSNTEWRVDNDSDFSSPVWTRTAGSAETSTSINATNGTFANELASESTLALNSTYFWQVRYFDGSDWSNWSTATSFTTSLSSAIEIRAQNYTDTITAITFPEGPSSSTIDQPYNNIDGISNPQGFGGAGTAKPVATLFNNNASPLKIFYTITAFTNSIVDSQDYLINTKGAACTTSACITEPVVFDTLTDTGVTIDPGAGNERDVYLKITLSDRAGATGTSTITILGEIP